MHKPYPGSVHTTVSPLSWGLESVYDTDKDSKYLDQMGMPKRELELRAKKNTYHWLVSQYDHEVGAFHGFYDPRTQVPADPQTANLIAPFQLVAAYDRYRDEQLLEMARRSSDWLENHLVETHPMSLVLGGVRDNIKPDQIWTKYTADYATLNLSLYERLDADEELLRRAIQSSKFLLQSQNHDFAPKYNDFHESWMKKGWQSFGRVIVAMIALGEFTMHKRWLERARAWAEYAIHLQQPDGCYYLINNNYYSSDIAADEMRALVRVYRMDGRQRYLKSAISYAEWHLEKQYENGGWPLSVDKGGVTVADYIGPGDIPNIAISMLLLHQETGDIKYLVSAARAIRYSLTQQYIPGQDSPFRDDPNTHWGFWSWDPKYDYTMSADQCTHHVRGYWFFLDYFLSLPEETQKAVAEQVGPPDSSFPRVPDELYE